MDTQRRDGSWAQEVKPVDDTEANRAMIREKVSRALERLFRGEIKCVKVYQDYVHESKTII